MIDQNRNVAIPTCRNQIRRYTSPDSCDEFPFASTYQGASRAGISYSVDLIDVKDNCTSGSRLGAWYQRNRILDDDPFWVDVIRKRETVPASGAPGLIASDPTPEEILDYDGCTVDGVS
ncbi:NucA/NucB deoxyribonuclease domain-containing protein [Microbispora sp. NBC_01189]|uniref:NucA/NucB deoxyribonuclease domain-containing protein n=1 Tax=Microbispora sp. NBC_01189 TaxID=2903583 RepID=UPI003A91326E